MGCEPVPAGMRIKATIMRSPSTQPPNTLEYAGPPMIEFTLAMSK